MSMEAAWLERPTVSEKGGMRAQAGRCASFIRGAASLATTMQLDKSLPSG
jgi:hypothetical protein